MSAAVRPAPRSIAHQPGIAAAIVPVVVWTVVVLAARASAARSPGPLDIAFLRTGGTSPLPVTARILSGVRKRAPRATTTMTTTTHTETETGRCHG